MKIRHAELILGLICFCLAILLIILDIRMSDLSYDMFYKSKEEAQEEKDQGEGEEETEDAAPMVHPPQYINQKIYTVKKGQSFSHLLHQVKPSTKEFEAILKAVRDYFHRHKLHVGQKFVFILNEDPKTPDLVRKILFYPNRYEKTVIEVHPEQEESFRVTTSPLKHHKNYYQGTIESSLFLDAKAQGVSQTTLNDILKFFSYSIDFQRSLRKGDQFEILVENFFDPETGTEFAGDLLFAQLKLCSGTYELYRYVDKNASTDYYNSKGEGIRKPLLKTPISGARISSGYGPRKHPVLGYSRMHRGIDFAARVGTPIMAAGEGTIKRASRYGSYGNYVLIQHNNEYATAYAHLSRYAKGIKPGVRVKQGQVIAYVGATGRCTGPHLHYEVHRHGHQINPQNLKMPSQKTLQGKELQEFKRQIKTIEAIRQDLSTGVQKTPPPQNK